MRWKFGLVLFIGLAIIAGSQAADEYDEEDVQDDVETEESASTPDDAIQNYESPKADSESFYFAEHFDDHEKFLKNWVKSEAKKDDIAEEIAKYDGEWAVEAPSKQILKNDLGLVLKSKAKHAAIASRLTKPFDFRDPNKVLIVQYEVTMQDGQDCGGSYIKLLSSGKDSSDLTKFNDKTPYTIMFGPDKCGNDVKLHFIFRYTNPINGSISEKHCRKPKERLEEPFKDKLPHLYRLHLQPSGQFTIQVDEKTVNEGNLLADFTPPVNPPREIDDPADLKPENWDEREKIADPDSKKPEDWDEDAPPQIPDPNAVKPEGWLDDEEEMIPDPNAKKPEDWDQEIDGEWEAPLIENPICEKAVGCGLWKAPLVANVNYKGKWRAPLIDNPNYQGKWAPRKIPNPDYFEDLEPYKKLSPISAVGIEIWSMSNNILFDNLVITDNLQHANDWVEKTYSLKRHQINKESKTLWERLMRHMGYKPGWWALYFLYCAVPAGFYIRFLLKCVKDEKENFISKLVKLTNDNPWLWALYILIVGVPLSFVIYSLCTNKDKKNQSAKSKKTDEPTPDDEPSSIEKEEPQQQQQQKQQDDAGRGDADTKQNPSPKSKKSDLEVDEIENVEDKDDDEVDNEIAEEISTEEAAVPQATEGAKKRRPRKE